MPAWQEEVMISKHNSFAEEEEQESQDILLGEMQEWLIGLFMWKVLPLGALIAALLFLLYAE